ncbi:hypothetical protein BaRGS_00031131 [Batillaria attramentaria]|uniref:Uncharacterized protein n=1 Tax=Batillaria attramentaria TaxID=370345 RepID=A0ABD0JRD0_9CAEN
MCRFPTTTVAFCKPNPSLIPFSVQLWRGVMQGADQAEEFAQCPMTARRKSFSPFIRHSARLAREVTSSRAFFTAARALPDTRSTLGRERDKTEHALRTVEIGILF